MSETLSLEPANPALLFRPQMMIGAATPLWGYFTGAALTGMALWWMSRWMPTPKLAAVAPTWAPPEGIPKTSAALPVVSEAAPVARPAPAAVVEPEAEPILDAEFVPAPPRPRKTKQAEAKAH